jgi:hypothetical protein
MAMGEQAGPFSEADIRSVTGKLAALREGLPESEQTVLNEILRRAVLWDHDVAGHWSEWAKSTAPPETGKTSSEPELTLGVMQILPATLVPLGLKGGPTLYTDSDLAGKKP